MFEIFMRQSSHLPYYSDSGPGTKYLRMGNTDLGFFGLVPEVELGFFTKMLDDAQIPEASRLYSASADNQWMKFFFKGSVVFIPTFKTALVTYNQLQAAKMTYSGLKRGTADAPATLPDGSPMYDMNPVYTAPNKDLLFPRLIDLKPNATSVVYDEVLSTESEAYNLIVSVFGANWTNPQGIRLPASYINGVTAGQQANTSGVEIISSTVGSVLRLDTTNADMNKVAQTSMGNTTVWLPVVQLLTTDDKKKLALPISNLESWSDAVNSQPVIWGIAESMLPPYNFRAPLDQSIVLPTMTVEGLRSPVLRSARGPVIKFEEYAQMSFVAPMITGVQSFNEPGQISRSFPVSPDVVRPEAVYEGTAIQCCSGWVNGNEMYTPFGMGGTQGGGEDKYPAYMSVFNFVTKTKRRIAPGTPSGFTWYSGCTHNGRFYMMNGYIAGSQTKNMYSWPVANPSSPTAHAATPGSTRVVTNVCSLPTQNKIMLVGGYNLSGTTYNEAGLYDVATNTWSVIAPPGMGLYYAALAATPTKVYLIGGLNTTGSTNTWNTVIRVYDIASNTWSTLPMPTTYGFKAIGQATVVNNKVVAIGGFSDVSPSVAYAVILDLSDNSVRIKALGIPPQSLGVCGLQNDGKIWVGPGTNPNRPGAYDDNRPRNQLSVFDPTKLVA